MAMIGKIRRMYFRDKLSLSEIARRTSLSRNTVKKWLRSPKGKEPCYRRRPSESKLEPFVEWLPPFLTIDDPRRLVKNNTESIYWMLSKRFIPRRKWWGEADQFSMEPNSAIFLIHFRSILDCIQ